MPATLELMLYALLIGSWPASRSARVGQPRECRGRRRSDPGHHLLSVPIFWVAVVLQLVFFSRLGILPFGGRLIVGATPPPTVTGLYT